MVFDEHEVRVARSMITMAMQLTEQSAHPLQLFTCYWAAFNNIYVTIAEQLGRRARLVKDANGSVCTRTLGHVKVPKVNPVSERDQIDLAFQQFTDDLKRDLVGHPSTRFFVYRKPCWQGQTIESDINGQRLNGVLNVGYTVDNAHLVWAPIDTAMFEQDRDGARDPARCDALAQQILNVLYTVRNNTFHGSKSADDASDQVVLEKALPLLIMIVESFLPIRKAP